MASEPTAEDAHERADWHRVQQLYGQVVELLNTGQRDDELAGELAKAMARLCAAYDGEERLFVDHLLAVMHHLDPKHGTRNERFAAFYHDERFQQFEAYQSRGERRRPTPFEAAVETCRRLSDINRLREQLAPVPTGCILGGSTSYGRFFNTIGVKDNKPSDIDLVLVVTDYDDVRRIVDALQLVEGLREDDLTVMSERADAFPTILSDLGDVPRCIFSQRVSIWSPDSPDRVLAGTDIGGKYDLSLHILSGDDLDFLILRDAPRLAEERTILDYRTNPPAGPDVQHSFAGTEIEAPRTGTEWECRGGFLVPSRVCQVKDAISGEGDRYFPGQHQNLILPEFEVRWELDAHRLYLPLYSFKVKLAERLELERRARPYEIQRLSFSHTRRYAWAPYTSKRVDAA